MSADEYTPSEDDVRTRYVFAGLPDSSTSDQIARAMDQVGLQFDRFIARVRRDAVEEYKSRQVQIHLDPAPPQMVPVRCPKCGYR